MIIVSFKEIIELKVEIAVGECVKHENFTSIQCVPFSMIPEETMMIHSNSQLGISQVDR